MSDTTDMVLRNFLTVTRDDARACVADSDILLLEPRPAVDGPPAAYDGTFTAVEHYERAPDGTARVAAGPVPFTVFFPDDYLRSTDPRLQFRVARVGVPLLHPNAQGGVLCLGRHFRPGTRLRPLVEQLYLIVSGRVAGTADPFDAEAAKFYLAHPAEVRALRAAPLWRRAVAGRSRVEQLAPRATGEVP